MFVYFSIQQAKEIEEYVEAEETTRKPSFKGADFFLVKGVDGTKPRLWDANGQLVPTHEELTGETRRIKAQFERQVKQERALREQAEQRAAQERTLREQAEQRAAQERTLREQAEAELQRLREKLKQAGIEE